MNIAEKVIRKQYSLDFEDTVIYAMQQGVAEETDIDGEGVSTLWTFIDGSVLYLVDEVFYK